MALETVGVTPGHSPTQLRTVLGVIVDCSELLKPSAPDPAEVALVDLLQQPIDEAATHELHHKALISDPHPTDHAHRHPDPQSPADHLAPDALGQKTPRKIL